MEGKSSVEKVILVEKDQRVYDTWIRLLGMDVDEVLTYPIPEAGERTSDFLLMTSACSNRIARTQEMIVTTRMPVVLRRMFRQIAKVLPAVKGRVEVIHGNYTDGQTLRRRGSSTRRTTLAVGRNNGEWGTPRGATRRRSTTRGSRRCRTRPGQKIVCEQEGADWLPFEHLRPARNSIGVHTTEVVWSDPSPPESKMEFPAPVEPLSATA